MNAPRAEHSPYRDYAPRADGRTRSLSDIRSGEEARIGSILFGKLRDLCYDLGLHEGDHVRCRRTSAAAIVLETGNGRSVVLDQDWARFIRIA